MFKYGTKDLEEASFLWTHPFVKYEGCERRGVKQVFFNFSSEKEDMRAMVDDYHAKRATVEPKTFAQRQKDIRDILHKTLRRDDQQ